MNIKFKNLSGWGNTGTTKCRFEEPSNLENLKKFISEKKIVRGMGRSYGDSSIQKNLTISLKKFNKIIKFNKKIGLVTLECGVTIDQLLNYIIPYGWFIPVTPGSKFVSLGGAVSCDVHGKNHHQVGSIYNFINQISVINNSGEIVMCSPSKNTNLFNQIIGGMGLFGIIIEIELKLLKIENKYIYVEKDFYTNLQSILNSFNINNSWQYTVAWIDFMVKDSENIRGILYKGRHAKNEELPLKKQKNLLEPVRRKNISIFFKFPNVTLNYFSIKTFNLIYYTFSKMKIKSFVDYDKFFYPLDKIHNWNNLYGKNGFFQYQFVLPENNCEKGIREIFNLLIKEKSPSFLTVLKKFGNKNNSLLTFPEPGITVTLDFKNLKKNYKLLFDLDKIVLKYNGKIYLAKDARLSEETFSKFYKKQINNILNIRKNLKNYLESSQSERLNI